MTSRETDKRKEGKINADTKNSSKKYNPLLMIVELQIIRVLKLTTMTTTTTTHNKNHICYSYELNGVMI